jgi:hypothetical protein
MITVTISSSSSDGLKTVQTNATTWSALRDDLEDAGVSTSNMKGIVRSTRNTLESDDAAIPNEDFTLFLVTREIKSGFDNAQMMRDLRDAIENSYNEIISNIADGEYGEDEPSQSNSISSLEQERRKLERELSGR